MQFKFDILIPYLPQFGSALLVTLQVTISALLLGIVLAIPLSLFKILPVKPLNWLRPFTPPSSAACR